MFTEREKAVLGQYLTWFLAMRSDRVENEQNAFLDILEKAKEDKPDADYILISFEGQKYGYFRQSDETYLLDELAENVIEVYEKDKELASKILTEKYGEDVYTEKISEILNLLGGGK